MVYIKCFTLKEKNHSCSSFDVFIHGNFSTTIFFFLADSLTVFWKDVTHFHKKLCLRCYRCPKPSSIWTNINCKQSCSSAWQKITINHCEFNIRSLYLIFKIWYQSTKTRLEGDFVYELNTNWWLDYHQ